MNSDGISLVAIGTTIVVSILTVIATDFIGLRRDKAKQRMEFAWQLRQQRWEALTRALRTCPHFVIEQKKVLQSVSDLITWSTTQVEPWMGTDRVAELCAKRKTVEQWMNVTVQKLHDNPNLTVEVPSQEINSLRLCANQQLAEAIQRMRSEFSPLLDSNKY